MATLSRENVIAAMLVTGVVVIVGFASGLGLRTTTSNPQAAAPAATQPQPVPGTSLPESGLPQAVQPPEMTMPGTDLPTSDLPVSDLPADPGVSVGVDQPLPGGVGTVPPLPITTPGTPTTPGQPTTPAQPATPATCVPGVAQQVVDATTNVVASLPAVGDLTGTLGLTQAPGGTDPGLLNTLLYQVTGYCAPTEPPASLQAATQTQTLPTLPALPKVGG